MSYSRVEANPHPPNNNVEAVAHEAKYFMNNSYREIET